MAAAKRQKCGEPGEAAVKNEPGCLNDKATLNKFGYKLREKAPGWLKDYYEQELKRAKQKSSTEKVTFIEQVLENDDFDSDYFQRIKQTVHSKKESVDSAWISWKKLLDNEDEAVARLMIKQGKVITRPHSNLDHDSADVQELPEEVRKQYKYVQERESNSSTRLQQVTKTADNEKTKKPEKLQPVKDEEEEEDGKKDIDKLVQIAKRIHGIVASNLHDMQHRVGKFKDNERPGVTRTLTVHPSSLHAFNPSLLLSTPPPSPPSGTAQNQ